MCIKCGKKRTDYFTYGRGVRQGCVLYPLLFDLYLNEIPNPLKACNFNDPIILANGLPLSCLFYADDVVLFSSSATGLQNKPKYLSAILKKLETPHKSKKKNKNHDI